MKVKHIRKAYPWTRASIRREYMKVMRESYSGIPLDMQLPEPDYQSRDGRFKRWKNLPSIHPVWAVVMRHLGGVSCGFGNWEIKCVEAKTEMTHAVAYARNEHHAREATRDLIRRALKMPMGREFEELYDICEKSGMVMSSIRDDA